MSLSICNGSKWCQERATAFQDRRQEIRDYLRAVRAGENEKSKTPRKNCPGRDIAIHLSDIGSSSTNGSVTVILLSQALDLARLRFVFYWMVFDLFNTDKLQELPGQMISTTNSYFQYIVPFTEIIKIIKLNKGRFLCPYCRQRDDSVSLSSKRRK